MFKDRLKKLIEKNKLSATELARRAGVPRSNVQSWLTGSSPSIDQLGRVAQVLGITVDELYFGHKQESVVDDEVYLISIRKVVKKESHE